MSFRKQELNSLEEGEDIVEYPLIKNDIKEDNLIDSNIENKSVNLISNIKINENLLKLIEDIVFKTLNRNKVNTNNTRVNEHNLKIIKEKNKLLEKSKAIKKPKTKVKKKVIEKPKINWVYLK